MSAPPEAPRPLLRNPWVWAFLVGILTVTAIRPLLRREPPPPPVLWALPPFRLVDSAGEPFASADLAGRVWVVGFFFTRCTSICPLIIAAMGRLQARYDEAGVDEVRLLGLTVDPEYDSPERLRAYGAAHGVDPRHWRLLTGDPELVRQLVEEGFKTPIDGPAATDAGLIDIAHTGKLVLLDGQGRVRGFYGTDAPGLDEVFHRSRHVLDEQRRGGGRSG